MRYRLSLKTFKGEDTMHTKGEWTIEKTVGGYERIQSHGDIICWTANQQYPPVKEHEANARLISAAPDLLEACKSIELLLPAIDLNNNTFACIKLVKDLASKVSQAIAKATESKNSEGR